MHQDSLTYFLAKKKREENYMEDKYYFVVV